MSLDSLLKFAQEAKNIYSSPLGELVKAQQLQNKINPFIELNRKVNIHKSWFKQYPSLAFYFKAEKIQLSNKWIETYFTVPSKAMNSFLSLKYDFSKFFSEEYGDIKEEIVIKEAKNVKRIITDVYKKNSVLLQLESRQFEELIAELLNAQNFKVELTKQTRDNGYDILAVKSLNGFPLKFLVECKRYATSRPVGIEIIRSFSDVINTEKANKGIIVTTSYFTSIAKKRQAESSYLLDFRDREDVLSWINEYYVQKIEGKYISNPPS